MEKLVEIVRDYVKDLYPLTIVKDRYGGTYSGGKYTAWHLDYFNLPEEIDEDDCTCADFWTADGNYYLVGKGDTVEQAYKDLVEKVENFIVWVEVKGYKFSIYGIDENTKKVRNAIWRFNTEEDE